MPTLDSGIQDIVSNHTTTPIVNVMTGALTSAEIEHVRFDVWLCGLTACKVRPGLQWSDDGISWDTAVAIDLAASPNQYASTEGWTYSAAYTDIFALGSPKLFVRFVAMAVNTSGTATEAAQCRLKVRVKPVRARTIVLGPMRVHNKGSTNNWVTFVASAPIPADQVGYVRGTIELLSTSGDLEAKVAIQSANTPDVASDWGGDTDIAGTTRSSNGTTYGTTFATVSTTKDYLRLVIKVRNSAGADIEAARVAVRVDFRAQ